MNGLPDYAGPESDVVVLELPDVGYRIDKWLSYLATSDYTRPTDEFSFELAGASIPISVRKALRAGTRCRITVDDYTQADGYVTSVESNSTRNGGWTLGVRCHDKMAIVCRAGADPKLRFSEHDTLADVMAKVFGPFGFTDFLVSAEAVRNARTGATKGAHLGRATKKHGPAPLTSYRMHELKPYPHEGAYQFAARVAERFGLWIHPTSQGNALVIGKPEFDQDALYSLVRKVDDNNAATNILAGTVTESSGDQPSCIVATGTSRSNDFDGARIKVICVNELVALDGLGNPLANVQAVIDANNESGSTYLAPRAQFASNAYRPNPYAVPVYLHDQDSQTLAQLENFARREMALKQRASLVCHYTVEGHTSHDGSVWTVDTIVDVDDDVADIHEPMWIQSRAFEKSRNAGTVTHLELIRPWTLFLGGDNG